MGASLVLALGCGGSQHHPPQVAPQAPTQTIPQPMPDSGDGSTGGDQHFAEPPQQQMMPPQAPPPQHAPPPVVYRPPPQQKPPQPDPGDGMSTMPPLVEPFDRRK